MGDAIAWWLTLEILGLAAWPVAWIAMRRLPDRGWAFSKALGLLLVGYLAWLIGMFQLAPFGRGSNILMLLALIGASAWLALRNGRALWTEMRGFLRGQMRYWLFAEGLFLVAFAAWAVLRAYSPNIYGTEKFMDFGFLNSFTQGETLPPADPWLAGYSINYYYFGYTLMATLCHLSGVDSAIGFNLANVTLFSLTVLGGFGLVYNLVAGVVRARRGSVPTRAVTARVPVQRVQARAVAAPLPTRRAALRGSVALVEPEEDQTQASVADTQAPGAPPVPRRDGNGHAAPAVPPESQPAVPWSALLTGVLASFLIAIAGNMAAAGQVLNQHQTADSFNWWTPSRVVIDQGAPVPETINEFPFFSFLLNDMHPHMLALPLVLLALGLGLALLKAGAIRPHDAAGALARRRGLLGAGLENHLRLFVYALVTGSLFIANTWDYPTYLLVVLVALALPIIGAAPGRWRPAPAVEPDEEAPAATWSSRILEWRETRIGSWVTQTAALVALGLLLYLPFHLTFKSLVGGEKIELPPQVAQIPILGFVASKFSSLLGVNIWPKTWEGFITIFGFFLYAIIALALVMLVRAIWDARSAGRSAQAPLIAVAGVVVVSLLGALLFQFPLMALLPPLAAIAIYLIRERLQPGRWSSEELFALTLIAVGATLTFGTEVFFLQDVFHGRINTLFKFYYQVWVIWGAAAAFATWWLLAWAFGRQAVPGSAAPLAARGLVGLWSGGFAVLFALAMIYPALAPAVRDNGISWVPFFPVSNPADHKVRGLDGIAWLGDSAPGDLAAIRWIRDNVHGPQGVAEAAFTYEYNMQGMHGRVSAYTGQPTIVAWHGHEVQWRGGQPEVLASLGPRESDQDELYATTDVKRAQQIMQKYGIRYVFVGTIEKGEQGRDSGDQGAWKYSAQALAKFGQFMQPVFNSGGATVYMLPDVAAASPGGGPNPGALPHP